MHFILKTLSRHERVGWSDGHFRESERRDWTVAQQEMEAGAGSEEHGGETGSGLA